MSRTILGESSPIVELKKMIHRVAEGRTNILIIGESGTGKELVARMIHDSSPSKVHPFVPINCGAIPENLIETEMFGHRKGSFTGAVSDKVGLFEVAGKGTLFLDEIGELSLSMQVKLLRAIQERIVRKVGGVDDIRVDARIIAATNRDLEAAVKKGTFREDLYYRLNVILIKTPPLRDRGGDVRLLSEKFLQVFAKKAHKVMDGFEDPALKAIESYSWPGNVRELENCIERAVTMESGSRITLAALPLSVQNAAIQAEKKLSDARQQTKNHPISAIELPVADFSKGILSLDSILNETEKYYLTAAIRTAGGISKKTADLLGITLRSLRYRLEKLGISD